MQINLSDTEKLEQRLEKNKVNSVRPPSNNDSNDSQKSVETVNSDKRMRRRARNMGCKGHFSSDFANRIMQVPVKKDPIVKVFEYPLEMIYNEQINQVKESELFWRINPTPIHLDLIKVGSQSKLDIIMLNPHPQVQRDLDQNAVLKRSEHDLAHSDLAFHKGQTPQLIKMKPITTDIDIMADFRKVAFQVNSDNSRNIQNAIKLQKVKRFQKKNNDLISIDFVLGSHYRKSQAPKELKESKVNKVELILQNNAKTNFLKKLCRKSVPASSQPPQGILSPHTAMVAGIDLKGVVESTQNSNQSDLFTSGMESWQAELLKKKTQQNKMHNGFQSFQGRNGQRGQSHSISQRTFPETSLMGQMLNDTGKRLPKERTQLEHDSQQIEMRTKMQVAKIKMNYAMRNSGTRAMGSMVQQMLKGHMFKKQPMSPMSE